MKKLICMIMAVCMIAALCACGKAPAAEPSSAPAEATAEAATEAPAAEGGTLVVGTSADYAPYEFMYPDKDGNMVYGGIDLSVAQYVADEMGKEMQVENMGFDYLLVSLSKGDYDIVIAAMEDTEERRQAADFSDPYYTDLPAMILVKKDVADQYTTLASFDGKTVGAQTATTKLDIVNNDMPGAVAQPLQNVNDLINELVNDKIDAVVLDGAVAMQYADNDPNLVVASASDELGAAAPYCIAVAKGDPKGLLPGINAAIAKMTEANAIEQFIVDAEALQDAGVAEEVSAEAPAESPAA